MEEPAAGSSPRDQDLGLGTSVVAAAAEGDPQPSLLSLVAAEDRRVIGIPELGTPWGCSEVVGQRFCRYQELKTPHSPVAD